MHLNGEQEELNKHHQALQSFNDSTNVSEIDSRTTNTLTNTIANQNNNHENSNISNEKLKLKLMQKQLVHLTNLIHNALMNGDLSQLASIEYNLSNKKNFTSKMIKQHKQQQQQQHDDTSETSDENNQHAAKRINYKKGLNELLVKIKEIKQEYNKIKKLHENFNFNVNDSIKTFVNKLNVRLVITFNFKVCFILTLVFYRNSLKC